MINKKLAPVILAASILLPQLCSCSLIPDPVAQTSLPTIPEESSSEVTTTASETTIETTEPSAEERVIVKTPDGKTVIDTTYFEKYSARKLHRDDDRRLLARRC